MLVTGAKGFIGKNLVAELKNRDPFEVFEYDLGSTSEELSLYCAECDFVFHLAGVNRPKDPADFMKGNCGFLEEVVSLLKKNGNPAPLLISSSIQAALENPYGESKLAAEELLLSYTKETGAPVFIYRLPNVFGKWCRPNYNSVVATFCYNIAHSLPIRIDNEETELSLIYIDDVVELFLSRLYEVIEASFESAGEEGSDHRTDIIERENIAKERATRSYQRVPEDKIHSIRLGELAGRIQSFYESRKNLILPDFSDALTKKLYSTYLSYLPEDAFSYPLLMHEDVRGSFTEFIKGLGGQVSINVIRPGIVKGNHWHHTKNEKFLVVRGKGCLRFRKYGGDQVLEYHVSEKKLEVIDIPCGYIHNITNEGDEEAVVVIWANEIYDPKRPDTYHEDV
ncbi:MAG: NAD-dependent epimerase/dehydratase family protein [Lachnospiraceae bacterium]|nr:NAD-dependent epimerase/dehydratase family protein [Lachnospiraceae bacterium]